MRTPIAALSAAVALSIGLGVVASGCGGETAAGNATTAVATADRQAAGGSPRRAPCRTEGIEAGLPRSGLAYISCVDQPVTVWAADVDPYDWLTGRRPDKINGDSGKGPGTPINPSSFLRTDTQCNSLGPRSWGWRIGVTLTDGSKASVRAQLPDCRRTNRMWQPRFNTANGPTSVVLTTDSGKRVKLVTKDRTDVPGLKDPDFFLVFPIYIESVLL